MAGKADEAPSARAVILARIRGAMGPAIGRAGSPQQSAAAGWHALPRDYRRTAALGPDERLLLLEDRLRDYGAHVERVTAATVPKAIGRRLLERGEPTMLVPAGLPEGLLPRTTTFTEDAGFSATELDRFSGVLTLAAAAIATTGTLVLQNLPGQGRRAATLIPDYHLCIVAADDVMETVPEAMDRLRATAALPTTFISGPSATADIEMTRIQGVHGPRVLDVLVVVAG